MRKEEVKLNIEERRSKMKRFLAVMVAFVFVLLAQAQFAHATAILTVSDNAGHSVSITDNSLGDLNSLAGAVLWQGALGNWTVNVDTGQSHPVLSYPNLMDLSVVGTTNSSGGHLTATFSDNGFGPSSGPVSVLLAAGGTADGTEVFTFLDNGTLIATSPVVGPGHFSGSEFGYLTSLLSTDTLELTTDIYHSGAGTTSSDENAKVPEPGTLLLLGVGFLGFAVVGAKLAKQGA
ncbi:MAG: PEP-CTERM sorting domain-containing protein [Nitrospiraceae bacterium]|nr:PEP-CTERM sorting domain-containing protein [Nitrospiraceae bacterium]